MARIDIGPNSLVSPHSHPRASEVAILLKGMIHFLYNTDSKVQALALSGLSSQNPGVQMASPAAFATCPTMPDEVSKKLFQINDQDVTKIRTSLGG
ncbi:hypothetical protein KY284_023163 [Solanum tuberosum]|nr:hypothetical protein KY284_023163 [Solanum tuberosum]